jgi:TFIIF-interacting CTD phosphatase-like protein
MTFTSILNKIYYYLIIIIFCQKPIEDNGENKFLKRYNEISLNNFKKKKKILILDLDETLVHSSQSQLENYDHEIKIDIEGSVCKFYVAERPHLKKFLKRVKELFHVIIFTASIKEYADEVINKIDNTIDDSCRFYREVSFLLI